jgi:hypothetical protein
MRSDVEVRLGPGDQPVPRRSQRRPETIHLAADPDTIIAAANRGYQTLDSIH